MTPYWQSANGDAVLYCGDALDTLRQLPDESVHCCITSPPYWGGVRDYGSDGQIGIERDPLVYAKAIVDVFAEVRRVIDHAGCAWLNLGETYAASGMGGGGSCGGRSSWGTVKDRKGFRMPPAGYKMKDQTLVPFTVADALRRDGWYLRSTVVWSKPSSEPIRLDRPSVSHEYVFQLAPSEHYATRNPGEPWWQRSVWEITPERYIDHPASMPRELVRRCIECSTEPGQTVLDPFAGSCTTGVVALKFGRLTQLIELNPSYCAMGTRRLESALPENAEPLFAEQLRQMTLEGC